MGVGGRPLGFEAECARVGELFAGFVAHKAQYFELVEGLDEVGAALGALGGVLGEEGVIPCYVVFGVFRKKVGECADGDVVLSAVGGCPRIRKSRCQKGNARIAADIPGAFFFGVFGGRSRRILSEAGIRRKAE